MDVSFLLGLGLVADHEELLAFCAIEMNGRKLGFSRLPFAAVCDNLFTSWKTFVDMYSL